METKSGEEPRLPHEDGNQIKAAERRRGGKKQQLDQMFLFVVSNLMSENGFQFELDQLGDQCVKQDNFSESTEAGKKGIGVPRALAPVHNLNAAGAKTRAFGQFEQPLAQ